MKMRHVKRKEKKNNEIAHETIDIFGVTKENGVFIMEIAGEHFAFFAFPSFLRGVCFLIIVFGN